MPGDRGRPRGAVFRHQSGKHGRHRVDGSRVLGLGDIGPEAGLPVMEGKALLFKLFGGVDAIPLCIRARDAEDIVRTVELIDPSFGGINLGDIAHPKGFGVLDEARRRVLVPVW